MAEIRTNILGKLEELDASLVDEVISFLQIGEELKEIDLDKLEMEEIVKLNDFIDNISGKKKEMRTYTVKISLGDSFRRFSMKEKESLSFAFVKSRILNFFPNLDTERHSIKWKDEEGDMVTISCDEELKEAWRNATRKQAEGKESNTLLLRLFVVEKQMKKGERCKKKRWKEKHCFKKPQVDSTLHPALRNSFSGLFGNSLLVFHNALCDSCDRKISGSRYKCLDCDDFDLCEKCFRFKEHPKGHCFKEITALDALTACLKHQKIILDHLLKNEDSPPLYSCQRCTQMIEGVRWKCSTCQDYGSSFSFSFLFPLKLFSCCKIELCNDCYLFNNTDNRQHKASHICTKLVTNLGDKSEPEMEENLKSLEKMGFADQQKNRAILEKCNNNLEQALQQLF